MAGPTPREVFLALCSGARLCMPKGIEGRSRDPLVWQRAGIIRRSLGERIVDSQVKNGASGQAVAQYLRFVNPASFLTVEFRRLAHQVGNPKTVLVDNDTKRLCLSTRSPLARLGDIP